MGNRDNDMRIAALIISLACFALIVLQSCAVGVGGSLGHLESLKQGAAVGAVLAFVYILGAAFVMGFPLVSAALFAIGAVISIPAGYDTGYSDLMLWGGLAVILAFLSIFGYREKRGEKSSQAIRSNSARQAVIALLLIGMGAIAYPLYVVGVKFYRLPAIYDVTTDPIDPPRFEVIARLRPSDAHPVTYAGLYAAEQQRASYPDIEPNLTDSSPQEAYEAALKVITKRKWAIVDARPPQGAGSREGHIEAIAHTILGSRDDVAVRLRATPDGSRIDVRSASRYGRSDLGANATRVRDLISDIDDVLAARQPESGR
jgi:uncharacterized protein (DUF1499 family)